MHAGLYYAVLVSYLNSHWLALLWGYVHMACVRAFDGVRELVEVSTPGMVPTDMRRGRGTCSGSQICRDHAHPVNTKGDRPPKPHPSTRGEGPAVIFLPDTLALWHTAKSPPNSVGRLGCVRLQGLDLWPSQVSRPAKFACNICDKPSFIHATRPPDR